MYGLFSMPASKIQGGKQSVNQSTYKSFDELPLMISVPEAASVLGISRAGAYDLARSRGFPAINIGSRIVIPKEQFIRWIEKKLAERGEEIG